VSWGQRTVCVFLSCEREKGLFCASLRERHCRLSEFGKVRSLRLPTYSPAQKAAPASRRQGIFLHGGGTGVSRHQLAAPRVGNAYGVLTGRRISIESVVPWGDDAHAGDALEAKHRSLRRVFLQNPRRGRRERSRGGFSWDVLNKEGPN
jgi:hypothetical protein